MSTVEEGDTVQVIGGSYKGQTGVVTHVTAQMVEVNMGRAVGSHRIKKDNVDPAGE